jgi:hypothetical protein
MVDVMTIDTLSPNVFDVAWPTFAYQDAPGPDEARHHQAGSAAGTDRTGPVRA